MSFLTRRSEATRATDRMLNVGERGAQVEGVSRPREIHIEAEDGERNGRIDKGSRLSGKASFEGTVRVYGEVEGELEAGEAVIVRRAGRVRAEIHASEVVIEGEVVANVHATGRVEIGATGKLWGTVVTPCLILHEGALFEGHCEVPPATASREVAKDGERHLVPLAS